jgi:hypothetical protein
MQHVGFLDLMEHVGGSKMISFRSALLMHETPLMHLHPQKDLALLIGATPSVLKLDHSLFA